MTISTSYLHVPYAQKDAAKALGAKWDAAKKQWFVPVGTDLSRFSQWLPCPSSPARPQTTLASPAKHPPLSKEEAITLPQGKQFTAYAGDTAPWC
ncbi:MAG: hypothetical protein D4R63_09635 [Methylococcaceae bacterium]|nr:MAG: hypothetical protein D4R63_09635 [Methylococcaceae bacterium]